MSTTSHTPAVQANSCVPLVVSSFSHSLKDDQFISLGKSFISSLYLSELISWYGACL